MRKITLVSVLMAILTLQCVEVTHPFSKIPPGIWRATLQITDNEVIPFNFEAVYDENDRLSVVILNDTERIVIDEVYFGKNAKYQDTLLINFSLMDSYISAEYKENVLEGHWVRRNRENYQIPFVAHHGQDYRFTTNNIKPAMDVTGKWNTTFEVETADEYPAIGEFLQTNNKVTGTFMTETGDYRYLQGEIQGNEVFLSCFDGGHAFLFTATVTSNNDLLGKFYSGNHYMTNWTAFKDENARLTNPYNLSSVINPGEPLNFTYPNSDNQPVSINDDRYSGKAKVITIMGTWCPNCLDESKFLLDYKAKNPDLDFEIIAIAFEKYRNADKAFDMLKTYKDRLKIPYEIVLGGYYDKKEATHSFEILDTIMSYPTLLFLDKSNMVTKVHTGFAGPATSAFEDFSKEFDKEIRQITGN